MASNQVISRRCEGVFSTCKTDVQVHNKLRTLLCCDYLDEKSFKKFRLNAFDFLTTPAERSCATAEEVLECLTRRGRFVIGQYEEIKNILVDADARIGDIINEAEGRIKEIKENAVPMKTVVSSVQPESLLSEAAEKVDSILLSVFEFVMCKVDQGETDFLDNYEDLEDISEDFIKSWHGKFCRCRRSYGQKLVLKFVESGAKHLKEGGDRFEHFKAKVAPGMKKVLQKCASRCMGMYLECGIPVAAAATLSVLSYWIFEDVDKIDTFRALYKDGTFDKALDECFNTEEALTILEVRKVVLQTIIRAEDCIKNRDGLAQNIPKGSFTLKRGTRKKGSVKESSDDPVAKKMKYTLHQAEIKSDEYLISLRYTPPHGDVPSETGGSLSSGRSSTQRRCEEELPTTSSISTHEELVKDVAFDEEESVSTYTVKHHIEIENQTLGDKYDTYVHGIVIMSNIIVILNRAIILDKGDILQLFTIDGRYLSSSRGINYIRGITKVRHNELAALRNDKEELSFWKVDGDKIRRTSKIFILGQWFTALDFNGNYFCLISRGESGMVTILDKFGKIAKQFQVRKAFGISIFFGDSVHMDEKTNNIYIPNRGGGILCVSMEGTQHWISDVPGIPGEIVEINGDLCVASLLNNCVLVMSKEGKYKGILLPTEGQTTSLCYDKVEHFFVLSMYDGTNKASVYKISI